MAAPPPLGYPPILLTCPAFIRTLFNSVGPESEAGLVGRLGRWCYGIISAGDHWLYDDAERDDKILRRCVSAIRKGVHNLCYLLPEPANPEKVCAAPTRPWLA